LEIQPTGEEKEYENHLIFCQLFLSFKSKHTVSSSPQIYRQGNFISLYGLVTADNPSFSSDESSIITGTGSGFGYYEGIKFTHLTRPISINLGMGFLSSSVMYKNFASTIYYNNYSLAYPMSFISIQNSPTRISTIILQMYFGVSFCL